MIRDEYTNSQSSNIVNKSEFGDVQRSEFSDSGKMGLHKSAYNPNLTKNTSSTSESASNVTSSTASEATTVASSSTASTIASVSTGAVVVASTVAITAISVVTGISIALHDYQYHFSSFVITSNQLIYELDIDDLKLESYEEENREEEENPPFIMTVSNAYYEREEGTWLGSNYGSFTGLNLGEKYKMVLKENRYGGETLFEEYFVTYENSTVYDFSIYEGYNYQNHTFGVYLSYIDELNVLSDFQITLSREEQGNEYSVDLPLQMSDGYQDVSAVDVTGAPIDLDHEFHYVFSYMKERERITYKEGDITFYNASGMVSQFNNLIFDGSANFINNTFDVQLDYVDDYNYYSDFVLTLSDARGNNSDIYLEKTTDVQTFEFEQYNLYRDMEYDYVLTCNYQGENTTLTSGSVKFTDTSGGVTEFKELIFNKKANFDTREITLQLDYVDDFGYLSDFQFILTDLVTSNSKTLYLEKTLDEQTFAINDMDAASGYQIDVTTNNMSYSFKYYNNGQEVTVVDGEEFKFENSLVSVFNGIESPFDFVSDGYDGYVLPIKFDFDDAAHEYDEFEALILQGGTEIAAISFEGSPTTNWQFGYFYSENSSAEAIAASQEEITFKVNSVQGNDEAIELYSKVVTFTVNETQELYGGYIYDENIYYGNYTFDILPIFTGSGSNYEAQVIVETSTNKTYTTSISFANPNEYVTVPLSRAEEGFSEEDFEADFTGPVKITLKYRTVTYPSGTTGATSDPIYSEYISMVLYDNFTFVLSA